MNVLIAATAARDAPLETPAESPELPLETINRLADQETVAESVAKVVEYLETHLSAVSRFEAVSDNALTCAAAGAPAEAERYVIIEIVLGSDEPD